MARVLRRPRAAEDLAEISDCIAGDSLDAADRWVDQHDERFRLLASQPLMGRARAELAAGLRGFSFGRYIVFFYMPIDRGIDVVRVLHSARDRNELFGA